MNAYELKIRGLDNATSFARARWELFVFPDVHDLTSRAAKDRFLVLYYGDVPDPITWCRVLSAAGYPATPVGPLLETGEAA
jgi:hypothetical protein